MDGRPTRTDSDETGDYAVPNVLSPRDLVSRPDTMDETVPHMNIHKTKFSSKIFSSFCRKIKDLVRKSYT